MNNIERQILENQKIIMNAIVFENYFLIKLSRHLNVECPDNDDIKEYKK